MPSTTFILLGKTSDLAFAELECISQRNQWHNPQRLSNHLAIIDNIDDPQKILTIAGGSVKVFQELSTTELTLSDDIAADLIANNQEHFVLSSFQTKVDLKSYANEIRAKLREAGLKPHFRLLETPYASAGIGQKAFEYVISESENTPSVLKTIAVQNMRYWSIKDYDRPAIDPHSGMLPPKVARMMVNLGMPENSDDAIMYDPFCGSGTILVEGLDSGLQVIGSDISQKAVDDSQINCDWFIKRFSIEKQAKLFKQDVSHVDLKDLGDQVDLIVFEGYLGPPNPDYARLPNIARGLEKLYKGAFKNLDKLLKQNGKIVCALPEFVIGKSVKTFDSLIDWTLTLGYTRCNHFTYGRPQAIVKRRIYVLQKNAG